MTLVLEPPLCRWCGHTRTDCAAWDLHESYHRSSETTWRRAAAVLQPDHPNLPNSPEAIA
jgi:hypothetical protein